MQGKGVCKHAGLLYVGLWLLPALCLTQKTVKIIPCGGNLRTKGKPVAIWCLLVLSYIFEKN